MQIYERTTGGTIAGVLGLAIIGLAACGDGAREDRLADGGSPADVGTRVAEETPREHRTAPVEFTEVERPAAPPEAPEPPRIVTWDEAEAVFRSGEYAESVELFDAYTARKPENPWGYYMVGISAWRAGDLERAEAALRRTIDLDPEHRKGLLNLARVLLDQHMPSEALEHVERVVERKPESGEARRVLGNVHAELGATEKAMAAYRKALVLDPEDAWAMNNLALIMIRQGRYEEALPALARAKELRPELAVFQNNLGIALERNGYVGQAASAFRAAVEAKPGYEKAAANLARVEARAGATPERSADLAVLADSFAAKVDAVQVPSQDTSVAPEDTADAGGHGG